MNKLIIPALALGAVVACSGDSPTAPVSAAPAASLNSTNANSNSTTNGNGNPYANGSFPGWHRTGAAQAGKFVPLNCVPRQIATGSAVIGPSGGILQIGPHRLIVPAGALTERVLISGTVPEGRPFQIDLQPHGLQFRKAAGLILDASSCIDVPTIVYIVDQITVGPPIQAFYSNWWKAIACPIWHFSGYMISLGEE
jgi:hypothetical protein